MDTAARLRHGYVGSRLVMAMVVEYKLGDGEILALQRSQGR